MIDATNYNILVGQQTLYPLGFGLQHWTKEAWIRPGWSVGDNHRAILHVAFAATAITTPLSIVFGCGAIVNTLPYGSALMKESPAYMGSTEDQREMAPKSASVRHPNDHFLPWRNSSKLFQRYEEIILFLRSTTLVIPDTPLVLVHPILWRPLDKGKILVTLFGGIHIGLAAMLEVGLMIQYYVYVDNFQVSTRVVRHHLHRLMVLYSQQLEPNAECGCFSRLPRVVTRINEAD